MYYNGAFSYQDLPNVSSTYDIVNLYSLGDINSNSVKPQDYGRNRCSSRSN